MSSRNRFRILPGPWSSERVSGPFIVVLVTSRHGWLETMSGRAVETSFSWIETLWYQCLTLFSFL